MTDDRSPCCGARGGFIIEAKEGNYCSTCKEDVKGVEIKKSPEKPIPSHGQDRIDALAASAYQPTQPEFPAHPEKE